MLVLYHLQMPFAGALINGSSLPRPDGTPESVQRTCAHDENREVIAAATEELAPQVRQWLQQIHKVFVVSVH